MSTRLDINTCQSQLQPNVFLFTDPDNSRSFVCSNSNISCSDGTVSAGMTAVRVFGGVTYYFAVEAQDVWSGEYTLSISESQTLQTV